MIFVFQAPGTKTGSDGKPDPTQCEPFGLEAHYFTESRLLQRDVEVILESINNKNVVSYLVC
jgi:staphylococcal nuclease domain-containing protein 1